MIIVTDTIVVIMEGRFQGAENVEVLPKRKLAPPPLSLRWLPPMGDNSAAIKRPVSLSTYATVVVLSIQLAPSFRLRLHGIKELREKVVDDVGGTGVADS